MFVTYVNNIGPFLKVYGQVNKEHALDLERTILSLRNFLNVQAPPLITSLQQGLICLAKYTDENYFRSRIQSVQPTGLINVTFIDYGNDANISINDIRLLNYNAQEAEYLRTKPPQAEDFILSRIYGQWDNDQLEYIRSEICNETLIIVKESKIDIVTLIGLQIKGCDYVESLLSRNIGKRITVQKQEEAIKNLIDIPNPMYKTLSTNVKTPFVLNPLISQSTMSQPTITHSLMSTITTSTTTTSMQNVNFKNKGLSQPRPLHTPVPTQTTNSIGMRNKQMIANYLNSGTQQSIVTADSLQVQLQQQQPQQQLQQLKFNQQLQQLQQQQLHQQFQQQNFQQNYQPNYQQSFQPLQQRQPLPMNIFSHPQQNQMIGTPPPLAMQPNLLNYAYTNPQQQFPFPQTPMMYQLTQPPIPQQPILPLTKSLTTNSQKSIPYFTSTTLQVGTTHVVFCSYIEDGFNLFSVQLKSIEQDLDRMMADIGNTALQNLIEKPTLGMACIARYSEDKQLYRAVIMNISPTECQVAYVDYGNTGKVSYQDIYEIPEEFLTHNIFAMRFTLSGYKTLTPVTESLKSYFKQLILDKELVLKVMPLEGPLFVQYCELYCDQQNIFNLLKEKCNEFPVFLSADSLNERDTVVIRYVESPKKFFVQQTKNIAAYDNMMDQLLISWDKSPPLKNHRVGSAAIYYYSDTECYRAEIIAITEGEIKIQFVDFGNTELVNLNRLRTIDAEYLIMPKQAVECCLHGFETIDKLSDATRVQLELLAEDSTTGDRRNFFVIPMGYLNDIIVINLLDETIRPPLNLQKRMYSLCLPQKTRMAIESQSAAGTTVVVPPPANEPAIKDQSTENIPVARTSFNSRLIISNDRFNNNRGTEYGQENDRNDREQQYNTEKRFDRSNNSYERSNNNFDRSSNNFNHSNSNYNRSNNNYDRSNINYDRSNSNYDRNTNNRFDRNTNNNNRYDRNTANNSFDSNTQQNADIQNTEDWDDESSTTKVNDTQKNTFSPSYQSRNDQRSPPYKSSNTNIVTTIAESETWDDEGDKQDKQHNDDSNSGKFKNDRRTEYGRKGRYSYSAKVKNSIPRFNKQNNVKGGEDQQRKTEQYSYEKPRQFDVNVDESNVNGKNDDDINESQKQIQSMEILSFDRTVFKEQKLVYNLRTKFSIVWWLSPLEFYVQLKSDEKQFEHLMEKLQSFYKNVPSTINKPEIGSFVVVRYSTKDKLFYRCKIIDFNEKLCKYKLQHVDIGCKSICSINDIFEVEKQFIEIPQMAVKCSLLDVILNVQNEEILQQIDKYLGADKEIYGEFLSTDDQQMITFVNIDVESVNLRDSLIADGLITALPKELVLTRLIGQTIFIKIIDGKDLFWFRIQIHGWNIPIICAFNDVNNLLKLSSHLSNDFLQEYTGKEIPARIDDVTNCNVLKLSPLVQLLGVNIIPEICEIPVTSDTFTCTITYVETVDTFYVQNIYYANESAVLLDDLYEFYSNADSSCDEIKPNMLCVAKSVDDNWYRARILSVYNDDGEEKCNVYYIDYGNTETVLTSNIKPLDPKFMSSALTTKVLLPMKMKNDTAMEQIKSLTHDIQLNLHILEYYHNNWIVDLASFDGGSIIQILENGDYVERITVDELKQRISNELGLPVAEPNITLNTTFTTNKVSNENIDNKNSVLSDIVEETSEIEHFKQECISLITDESQYEESTVYDETAGAAAVTSETSSDQKHYLLKELGPKLDQLIDGFITHFDDPDRFYVQLNDDQTALLKLQENLQIISTSLPPLEDFTEQNQCVAKYSVDDNWYRAVIIDSDREITSIKFIDYGNTDTITDNTMIKATNESISSVKPFAILCSLPLESINGRQWPDDGRKIIQDLIADMIKFEYLSKNPTINYIKLYSSDDIPRDITQELLDLNLATKMEMIRSGEKCFISNLNSINDFSIQMESDTYGLELLSDYLLDESKFDVLTEFIEGTICIARYIEDDQWYRAKILSHNDKGEDSGTQVLFIDYGNQARVHELRKLPIEIANLPYLAKSCSLRLPESIQNWSEAAEVQFKEISAMGSTIFICNFIAPGKCITVDLIKVDDNYEEDGDGTSCIDRISVSDELAELCDKKFNFSKADEIIKDMELCSNNTKLQQKQQQQKQLEQQRQLDEQTKPQEEQNQQHEQQVQEQELEQEQFEDLEQQQEPQHEQQQEENQEPQKEQQHLDVNFNAKEINDASTSNNTSYADISGTSSNKRKIQTVYISQFTSPNDFFVQLESNTNALDNMIDMLSEAYEFPEVMTRNVGDICVALYDSDSYYYRAEILTTSSEGCEVLFIDYGNKSFTNDLRVLPENIANIERIATHCQLGRPNFHVNDQHLLQQQFEWHQDSITSFCDIINHNLDKTFKIDVIDVTSKPCTIQLYLNEKNINKLILNGEEEEDEGDVTRNDYHSNGKENNCNNNVNIVNDYIESVAQHAFDKLSITDLSDNNQNNDDHAGNDYVNNVTDDINNYITNNINNNNNNKNDNNIANEVLNDIITNASENLDISTNEIIVENNNNSENVVINNYANKYDNNDNNNSSTNNSNNSSNTEDDMNSKCLESNKKNGQEIVDTIFQKAITVNNDHDYDMIYNNNNNNNNNSNDSNEVLASCEQHSKNKIDSEVKTTTIINNNIHNISTDNDRSHCVTGNEHNRSNTQTTLSLHDDLHVD